MPTLTTEVLEHAERFIAGHEDDAAHAGVEQLLAQLRQATLSRQTMLRKLDSLELRGFGPGRSVKFYSVGTTVLMEISDQIGNSDNMSQRLSCPEGWSAKYWNPAHWSLSQTRIDNNGQTWTRYAAGDFVVDNFGDLVEVAK